MKRQNSLLVRVVSVMSTIFSSVLLSTSLVAQELYIEELASGLEHPWGMTFLPDGSMVISERAGALRRFFPGAGLGPRLTGVPEVVAKGQGGMLDVVADPAFATNQTIYFCYSRPAEGGSSSSVAKAKLMGNELQDLAVIFVSGPVVDNGVHFGCRLGFNKAGHLFATLGDRYKYMKEAQNTDNHHGTIVRITTNGDPVADNPFVTGKAPEVYTYGHRNVQGLTRHPQTDVMWAMEHGPKGGDEINILAAGNNYGWPTITYGVDYSGAIISDKTHMDGMEQPVLHWTPSIAPSGMTFYFGDAFPEWEGDLLVGSLKFTHLRRIDMNNTKPGEQFEYLRDRNERVRDVEVGPEGFIYLLTDSPDGKLIRLSPKN